MFEADTFVPSPDMKTHIWIRFDGCIITTMTSHPIDKTDGRQDSWQHGTKLVWAAVPSVVCCHDRGSSYYLDDCLPSLPGLIGLVLVREEEGKGGVSWKWKDGLIWAQCLTLLSFPLFIVDGRLGLLMEVWPFLPIDSLHNESVQINLVRTGTDCLYVMLLIFLKLIHLRTKIV